MACPKSTVEKTAVESEGTFSAEGTTYGVGEVRSLKAGSQNLHRKLRSKEVQLFAIGGAIGTSTFVQMGSALPKGGPAGLFLGFMIWGAIMVAVNECFAEMVCYVPISSPFIRLGGHWVDDALSFAMGWNFFLNMAFLVPFEIVAFNILLTFWTDKVPVEAVVVAMIVAYALLNLISVRYFGIAEFYLSIFKVFLILGCILFTFITMLGGNPLHDRYGFRYWRDPGSFVEYLAPGDTGRFLGVVTCIIQATFSICGPEYVAIVAGETEQPRKVLPRAFRSFVWRILTFFCGSALCMGIVIPYNDKTLALRLDEGSSTGAASPYVIAMENLKISGLPHIVNALIMTSVFSSGNGLLYSATRTLYGISLEGKAPKIFSRCTRFGVPIYAVMVGLAFCLLGFLQISNSSAKVLSWLVDLVTACQLLNYMSVGITYLHFHAALQKQGIDRNTLPYKGKFQPYAAYVSVVGTVVMMLVSGYYLFMNGGWDTRSFFLTYTIIGVFVLAFVLWKFVQRTTYIRPGMADLQVGGLKKEIDEYEEQYIARPKSKMAFLDRLF
ncbi:hypothetical protein DTO169E5_4696 [Paecilomyces variotii]|nr:hypothetical protein DTO169E5_4696 [Paecilomyces variotii]